ncbi:MAG: lipase/acyltransferase domain-containing protein [Panacagrimonas sp.]
MSNKAGWGTVLPGFAAALLVAACGGTMRPDLAHLYATHGDTAQQPPVIVIPGILGSRLRNARTGEQVWPGSLSNLLLGDQSQLALRFDPATLEVQPDDLAPDGLFEQALGQDYYGQILRTLERDGGFVRARSGQGCRHDVRRYHVFDYDWRQDNVHTARKLDELIEAIRRDCGDPALKVDVIAHSMGGLITRYYLRYGTRDVLDDNALEPNLEGSRKVRRAVLLGTPNLGSVGSLHGFLEGRRIGFSRVPPDVLASMPSVYQLFPHPLNAWLVGPDGQELLRDLFEVDIWRRFGWSIFDPQIRLRLADRGFDTAAVEAFERYFEKRLERARRFVWSLSRKAPPMDTRLILFGGDCLPTPARMVVEEQDGDSVLRLEPDAVRDRRPGVDYTRLMLEPGDGVVTKASLLARDNLDPAAPRHPHVDFPIAGAFFLCAEHGMLTGNLSFQDNLLHALLSRDWP